MALIGTWSSHLMMGPSPGLHIGLRNVTSSNQRVNASPRQFGAVVAKAVIQKWASNAIFAAERVIIPSTFIRHGLSDVRC